jgi:hypothetical protein
MGSTYYVLGNYQQATDAFTQTLVIAQETEDRQAEGNALGGLGNIQF